MDYFSLLHLQKEPFSNSPDPEMFFQSVQHQGCLQKLEIAIRLRRGLSVVIGDIGTGKSTLCRQLIQVIGREDSQILPYLILDPEFSSPAEFLTTMTRTLGLVPPAAGDSEWQLKDAIKNHLFDLTVQCHKIPVLIIDEGQKLPGFGVEILREFLNFETNQYKLLQIVIFAQEEFRTILRQKANFADRITTFHRLRPLGLGDSRAMIKFRIEKSHTTPGPPPKLFSLAAILAIYFLTGGYPRRIVMLCSKVILASLVAQRPRAGLRQVLAAAAELATTPLAGLHRRRLLSRIGLSVAGGGLALAALAYGLTVGRPPRPLPTPAVAAVQAGPSAVTEPIVSAPAPSPGPSEPPQSAPTSGPEPEPVAEAVPALAAATPPPEDPPAILGTLRVEPDVILSKMVARVYGRFSPKKLALVLRRNPQLTAPDHIEPGTLVTFPVLSPIKEALPADRALLELAQTPDLEEAYAILKGYPEAAPSLHIVAVRQSTGLLFHVLVEEGFRDAAAAEARRQDLPPVWRQKATVLSSAK